MFVPLRNNILIPVKRLILNFMNFPIASQNLVTIVHVDRANSNVRLVIRLRFVTIMRENNGKLVSSSSTGSNVLLFLVLLRKLFGGTKSAAGITMEITKFRNAWEKRTDALPLFYRISRHSLKGA